MTPSQQVTDLKARSQHMLGVLSSWSEDQLAMQPPEGGWCALEVLDHIITSERGTLGYMLKKSSSGWDGLEEVGEEHRSASKQLNDALKSPGRWSAPAVLPPPDPSLNITQLKATWSKTQDSMEQFVSSVPDGVEGKLVFKHPIAGRLTLSQTLEFLRYHIDHHLHQLDRIKHAISA